MKKVIDIPEILYTKIQNGKADKRTLETVILHGTPLPEGHGRLIDADALNECVMDKVTMPYIPINRIQAAPTIIEADTESEE